MRSAVEHRGRFVVSRHHQWWKAVIRQVVARSSTLIRPPDLRHRDQQRPHLPRVGHDPPVYGFHGASDVLRLSERLDWHGSVPDPAQHVASLRRLQVLHRWREVRVERQSQGAVFRPADVVPVGRNGIGRVGEGCGRCNRPGSSRLGVCPRPDTPRRSRLACSARSHPSDRWQRSAVAAQRDHTD